MDGNESFSHYEFHTRSKVSRDCFISASPDKQEEEFPEHITCRVFKLVK